MKAIALVLLASAATVDAQPARRPAPVPTVSIWALKVSGPLDKNLVRRYLVRNNQKFQYCYEKQLATTPKLEGELKAAWEIKPDGKVLNVGTMGLDGEVATCSKRVLESIEYPKPRGGKSAAVNVSFLLKPS